MRLFTFSHRNTSLAQRDALAYTYGQIEEFIPKSNDRFGGELAIVSTCNRTEFYHYGDTDSGFWRSFAPFMADYKGIAPGELGSPEAKKGSTAARHLFRVACSLESLALGENEILGQIKDAHQLLLAAESSTPIMDRLFQYAVRAGKEVRTQTSLCEGSVSVSSVAVELAHKIFGDFGSRTILLVGAGETAETAAEHFESDNAGRFVVVNRSRDNGQRLADRFDGSYRPLEELPEALADADIAVVATGAQKPLVTTPMLRKAMKTRHHDPVFLIDISNPRNVEPTAGDLSSVYLYNMDDLQQVVAANKAARRDEIPRAEGIIDYYVDQWNSWLQQRRVTPTISTLARYFEDVRQREIERHNDLSEEERSRLEAFSKGLIKKLLHDPITTLRSAVEDNSLSSEELDFLWSLYNLREFEEQSDEN